MKAKRSLTRRGIGLLSVLVNSALTPATLYLGVWVYSIIQPVDIRVFFTANERYFQMQLVGMRGFTIIDLVADDEIRTAYFSSRVKHNGVQCYFPKNPSNYTMPMLGQLLLAFRCGGSQTPGVPGYSHNANVVLGIITHLVLSAAVGWRVVGIVHRRRLLQHGFPIHPTTNDIGQVQDGADTGRG